MPSISMEELPPAGNKRRVHKDLSLTRRDVEAAVQLFQLSGDYYRNRIDQNHSSSTNRKLTEEEEARSEGDSDAHVSSSPGIKEKLQGQDKSSERSNRNFQSIIVKSPLTSVQSHNVENTAQPEEEIKAAEQLLLLCPKDTKARKEDQEERSNSGISRITCASSAKGVENLGAAQWRKAWLIRSSGGDDRREGESKSETSDLCSPISEWALEGGQCEALRQRRRKFRSMVDLYREVEPSPAIVSARKVRCW